MKKNIGGTGLLSVETEALFAELNKRAKADINCCSATDNFLQYICSVLVAKNHQKID